MFSENDNEPANNVFRKIYTKRKDSRKFVLCITFLGPSKCSDWFKLHRIAKISTQYKHFLYNQLGIAKMFYSV